MKLFLFFLICCFFSTEYVYTGNDVSNKNLNTYFSTIQKIFDKKIVSRPICFLGTFFCSYHACMGSSIFRYNALHLPLSLVGYCMSLYVGTRNHTYWGMTTGGLGTLGGALGFKYVASRVLLVYLATTPIISGM